MGSILHIVSTLIIFQILVAVTSSQSDTCATCQSRPGACRKIAGIFMVTVLSRGTYNPVVEIPSGACQINITELGPSSNYLAVKTKSSRSIVNSYWSIVPVGLYGGAGTVFRYSRNSGEYCKGQCIFTDGSLNETVVVQLLYYSKNPGISYEFLLPNYIAFTPFEGTFVPQHQHNTHNRHRQRQQTHRHRTHRQHQNRHISATFEGEQSPGYSSRSEGQTQTGNRQEFRVGGTSSFDRRYQGRTRPSSRTSVPRTYGYDTLNGRGLSYRQESTDSDSGKIPIKVAPRPRYVSPYDSNSRLRGHSTDLRSSLTDRTYVRGENDGRKGENSISNTYSGGHNVLPDQSVSTATGGSRYTWKISGFTDCSQTCGGGHQETRIVCVQRSAQGQVTVTDDNCNNAIKPVQQRVQCNTNPCAPGWESGEWSECSVTCGSGTQTRRVECKQRMSPTLQYSVSASKCDVSGRPAVAQQCEKQPCARWKTSKWGRCSVECGVGERRRKVKCVDHQHTQIPDRFCLTPAPVSVRQCDQGVCREQWWTSRWSNQCSNECGSGVKTRSVICGGKGGAKLADSHCQQSRRPQSQRLCRSQSACGGKWFTGPWGTCSAECGRGVRRRDVVCMKLVGSAMSLTVEENCAMDDKPIGEEQCASEACGSEWFMSQWSECSVSCGSGVKTRDVKCLDENHRRVRTCNRSHKPASRETCNMRECNLPQATRSSVKCKDRYRSCLMVLQARLCSYPYYRKICCASCKTADHS